jgi:hypothetical protein
MNRIEQCLIVAATGCALLLLGACTVDPSGRTLSADTSELVCQLTGDTDWLTGVSTTSKSATIYGFLGSDLGYPVEHGDRLALFFGDSRFNRLETPPKPGDRPESFRADDAIGWVTTRTPPTPTRCLDLMINHELNKPQNSPPVAVSPVVGPPFIKQGLFNVPSGGVSTGGSLYGFFGQIIARTKTTSKPAPVPKR